MPSPASRLAAYAAAAMLVRTADEGARVALTLLALDRRHSAALGGLLVAALLVPHVVAAPVIGFLADRSARPHHVMSAAAALFGASLIATALLLGRVPDLGIAALLGLGGCCGPGLTGALTSLLADLVPADRLPRAFGIDALTYNVAGICGPAVAAVVATAASAPAATAVLGAAAVIGAPGIAALPVRPQRRAAGAGRPGGVAAGARALVREPVLVVVTAASSAAQVGAGALPIIVVVAAARAHNPATAGWMLAAAAVGGLVGSALWTARPVAARRAPAVVMAAAAGAGAAVCVAAVHPQLPLLTASLFTFGVANGPLFGALLTTRQGYSPAELRTQVFAMSAGIKTTATAAGAIAAGAVARAATGLQLVGDGGLALLAGLGGAIALARVGPGRRVDRPAAA